MFLTKAGNQLWLCLWWWLCLCVCVCAWHVMSNAYVDPWDMLNNFCFHVYAHEYYKLWEGQPPRTFCSWIMPLLNFEQIQFFQTPFNTEIVVLMSTRNCEKDSLLGQIVSTSIEMQFLAGKKLYDWSTNRRGWCVGPNKPLLTFDIWHFWA